MENFTELPFDDRSHADGELFSIDDLYFMQGRRFLREHATAMFEQINLDKRQIRFIDLSLADEKHLSQYDQNVKDSSLWRGWHYYEARQLSDAELVEQRQAHRDHMLRALGHFAMARGPMTRHQPITNKYFPEAPELRHL